jgi:hypothetical protein
MNTDNNLDNIGWSFCNPRGKMKRLPWNKPQKKLKRIDCSFNFIKKINYLSDDLVYLKCDNNPLEKIPKLPLSLRYLEIGVMNDLFEVFDNPVLKVTIIN